MIANSDTPDVSNIKNTIPAQDLPIPIPPFPKINPLKKVKLQNPSDLIPLQSQSNQISEHKDIIQKNQFSQMPQQKPTFGRPNTTIQIQENQNVSALSQGELQDRDQALEGAKRQNYRDYGQLQMFQMVQNNLVQQGMNAKFKRGAEVQVRNKQAFQNSRQYYMQKCILFSKKNQN